MSAKNAVISGDYLGKPVIKPLGLDEVMIGKTYLNKKTVTAYQIIDETASKSAGSAIIRGAIGATLLGGVGLLAGLSAKSKGVHVIALQFADGKKSLIEIDDKRYKILMMRMF